MQEAVRATYQTDHTRLREQRTRHGPGYSWLLSCGEKEVRGKSSVWEVLTGKDEGAKQCRKGCRSHTHTGKEKEEKVRKRKIWLWMWNVGKISIWVQKVKMYLISFALSPLHIYSQDLFQQQQWCGSDTVTQPAHLKYHLRPKGSCSSTELNKAHNSCKMNFKNRLIFSLKAAGIQSVPDFWSFHSPEGQKDLSNRTLNCINDK